MGNKREVTIAIRGARMTELRQQQVGQALMIALAHELDGETDGVTITFMELL
jgi:hypothetical protein